MLTEPEFKTCIFAVIQSIRGGMADIATRVFEEERVEQAVLRGNSDDLIRALTYSLGKWIPDNQKVLNLVTSQVFGEVALEYYKSLKNQMQLQEGNNGTDFRA